MQDPSHSCEFHGAIKCAAVLAVAKFFASQNVAKESQFGSVCAHSALPLLRTLFPDAMSCKRCECLGSIKCAAVLAVAKFFASQNVANESQFGSVCAHSALPLLRTLVPDAM